jgi:hypothetical protein
MDLSVSNIIPSLLFMAHTPPRPCHEPTIKRQAP